MRKSGAENINLIIVFRIAVVPCAVVFHERANHFGKYPKSIRNSYFISIDGDGERVSKLLFFVSLVKKKKYSIEKKTPKPKPKPNAILL